MFGMTYMCQDFSSVFISGLQTTSSSFAHACKVFEILEYHTYVVPTGLYWSLLVSTGLPGLYGLPVLYLSPWSSWSLLVSLASLVTLVSRSLLVFLIATGFPHLYWSPRSPWSITVSQVSLVSRGLSGPPGLYCWVTLVSLVSTGFPCLYWSP